MQSIISQAAVWLIFISIISQSFPGIDFSSFNESKIYGQNGIFKVMLLGDSITTGYPSTGGYRPFLWDLFCEKKIKVDFVGSRSGGPPELPDKDNEGHGGWTALQLAEGVKEWVDEYKPDTVLLMAGTND
ncbi:MAG TPA: GDSL-type esterase/lipase family protein, partial [Clostridia bacterium]